MNKNIWVGIVVVVALGLGGWLFFKGGAPAAESVLPADSSALQSDANTPPPQDVTATQNQASAIKEFTVTGQNFSFTPKTISVKKGDHVKITFINSNGFHDFKIDEFGVATKRLQSGVQETVTFTADKAGTFEYYCSVGNHRAMGMKGTITVTE